MLEPPPLGQSDTMSRPACRVPELTYGRLNPETQVRIEAIGQRLGGGSVVVRSIRYDKPAAAW